MVGKKVSLQAVYFEVFKSISLITVPNLKNYINSALIPLLFAAKTGTLIVSWIEDFHP
jgi:hypothetical protein